MWCFLASSPSMASRCSCFPAVNGDAERLMMALAPAAASSCYRIGVIAAAAPEVGIIPDILADGYAQLLLIQHQDLGLPRRLEVTILVEDIIGGQQGLFECPLHPSLAQQGGAVEEGAAHRAGIGLGQPHQNRREISSSCGQMAQAAQLRSIKSLFRSRSRGGYPSRASSEVTARSAPAAFRELEAIWSLLPRMSPTMGLSCKRAIFIEVLRWMSGRH